MSERPISALSRLAAQYNAELGPDRHRPASHRQSDPFQPINTCTKIQIGLATTLSSPLGGHDKNGRFSSYHPETAESA